MSNRRILIVGSGIAGVSAAEAARKTDAEAKITLVGAEADLPVYRLRVAEVLKDPANAEKLVLHPLSWYKDLQIELKLDQAMQSINPDKKEVTFEKGEILAYDKLILTAGSRSFVPPIPGGDNGSVYTLWTMKSAKDYSRDIREKGLKTVAIIGGGLLGMEAAWQLQQAGVKVKILERSTQLLQRQLDSDCSELLRRYVESLGIEVIVDADTASIEHGKDGKVSEIVLKDGRRVSCDAVQLAVGVRANSEAAEAAGLEIGRRVKVNTAMESSVKDIYAAGDLCEVDDGYWFGLWSISMQQGKVAGTNAAGGKAEFTKITPPYVVNTMKTRIVSQGEHPAEEGDGIRFEITVDEDAYSYKKLVYKGDKLVGFILLGDAAKEMSALQGKLGK